MMEKKHSETIRKGPPRQNDSEVKSGIAGDGRNEDSVLPVNGYNRREFIKNVGRITAAGIAAGGVGLTPLLQGCGFCCLVKIVL